MKNKLFIFLLIQSFNLNSQIEIKGCIKSNGIAVQYASVYLKSKLAGDVSNIDGCFEILSKNKTLINNDSIIISAKGFVTKFIKVEQNKVYYEIELDKNPNQLEEVVIKPIKYRNSMIKKYSKERDFQVNSGIIEPYSEQAVFFENSDANEGYISSVSVYIIKKGLTSAPFRINIYSLNPINGEPNISLLSNDLILKSNIEEGWFKIQLDTLFIKIPKEGFFVSIEGLPLENFKLRTQKDYDSIMSLPPHLRNFTENALYLGRSVNKKDLKNYHFSLSHKETINWDKRFINSWFKNSNKSGHVAFQVEVKTNSKKSDPIDSEELAEFSKREIKRAVNYFPKYDSNKYPHSTIKEFFESNIKAIDNDQIEYLFVNLYITNTEDKLDYLTDLDDRFSRESPFTETEKVEAKKMFENILEKIETMEFKTVGENEFELTISPNQYILFRLIDGNWMAYPYINEVSLSIVKGFIGN